MIIEYSFLTLYFNIMQSISHLLPGKVTLLFQNVNVTNLVSRLNQKLSMKFDFDSDKI